MKHLTYNLKSIILKTLSLAWMRRYRPFGWSCSMLMGTPLRSFSLIFCTGKTCRFTPNHNIPLDMNQFRLIVHCNFNAYLGRVKVCLFSFHCIFLSKHNQTNVLILEIVRSHTVSIRHWWLGSSCWSWFTDVFHTRIRPVLSAENIRLPNEKSK